MKVDRKKCKYHIVMLVAVNFKKTKYLLLIKIDKQNKHNKVINKKKLFVYLYFWQKTSMVIGYITFFYLCSFSRYANIFTI